MKNALQIQAFLPRLAVPFMRVNWGLSSYFSLTLLLLSNKQLNNVTCHNMQFGKSCDLLKILLKSTQDFFFNDIFQAEKLFFLLFITARKA